MAMVMATAVVMLTVGMIVAMATVTVTTGHAPRGNATPRNFVRCLQRYCGCLLPTLEYKSPLALQALLAFYVNVEIAIATQAFSAGAA